MDIGKDGFGDIRNKAEEFLKLLQQGEDLSREVAAAAERLAALEEKCAYLDEENRHLMERFRQAEAEVAELERNKAELEEENNSLANLYVASFQLHSTLNLGEVLRTVLEIIMNLVGAEKSAVMMLDEKTGLLSAVAAEGVEPGEVPPESLGAGPAGRAAMSGEIYFSGKGAGGPGNPKVCIPLRMRDRIIGVIVIYSLFSQKDELTEVDNELFSMLAGQAATAIFASSMYAASERKLVTIQSFLDLLKEEPAEGRG